MNGPAGSILPGRTLPALPTLAMIFRVLLLALLAGLAGIAPAVAQTPEPRGAREVITDEPVGPPSRPASRVLDQTGALTSAERAALTRDFNASAESGLSLYFIALNSPAGLPPDEAATELARLWEDAPLTAVILHLPGQPMSLGFAGSRLSSLQQEEIESLAAAALTAGRVRQSMPEQGKAIARCLIEDFTRFRAGEALARPASAGDAMESMDQLVLWGGSAAIVFLLSLFLLGRLRRSRRPRLFPLTAPRERFSAPHSGGSNAIISFPNERG